jgi:HD domain
LGPSAVSVICMSCQPEAVLGSRSAGSDRIQAPAVPAVPVVLNVPVWSGAFAVLVPAYDTENPTSPPTQLAFVPLVAVFAIAEVAAQICVDFVAARGHDVITGSGSVRAQLREAWVYVVDVALSGVGLVVAQDLHSSPAELLFLVPLLGLFAMFAHERNHRLRGLLELNSAYRGTALVLSDERKRNLEFAALLHDVGKIAIPKEIVNKPGKLDPDEWTIIKTHTLEGEKMLSQVGGFMREVGILVRSHHERWDGRGYPDGLAGDQIPLEARIIAWCDSWNAMRTDRIYRKALPLEVALDELTGNAGSQFDPGLVEALLPIIERTEGRPVVAPVVERVEPRAHAPAPLPRPVTP